VPNALSILRCASYSGRGGRKQEGVPAEGEAEATFRRRARPEPSQAGDVGSSCRAARVSEL
jgi:hypothetical protein